MNEILAALINGAIASVLLTAAVWLALRTAAGRINAATRYLAWWTVLVVTVLLPLAYLPDRPVSRIETVPSQQALPTTIGPGTFTEAERSSPRPAAAKAVATSRAPWFPIRIAAGSVSNDVAAAWASLAALMLLRLACSFTVLYRRMAHSAEPPQSLALRLDKWLRQCGSRRRLRIAVTTDIAMPMVAGLRRPSILLPTALLVALDEDELNQIGIHEVAHVARGDDRTLMLQRIIEALLPVHPVVRWVARRIDLEREIACDDFVVRAFGSPRQYAACLTRVAELTGGVRSSIVATAVADERSHLTRRVEMLLDKTRHSGTRPLTGPLAAVITVILAVTRLAAHTPGMIVFTASADWNWPLRARAAVAPHRPAATPEAQVMPDPPAAPIIPSVGASPPPSGATKPAASTAPLEPVALLSEAISADVVRIPVAVREPWGRSVDLGKENFRLFEDGVEQSVAQVRSRPCTALGLLISASDSTDPKRAQMQAGFQEFARMVGPAVEFSEAQASTIAESSAAIDKWMGGLGQASDSWKVILVITDAGGGDLADDSAARLAEEQKRIAAFVQQDVLVYALNVANNDEAPTRFLTESTEQTGGRHLTIGAEKVVAAAFGIGSEVRNLYELEYNPKHAAHAGASRTVRVELIVPHGLPLNLNYRPGYYEPRR